MRKILVIAISVLCLHVSAQQDIHFTQFDAAQLQFNPAAAGMFRGDIRFVNNFRQQWSTISVPYMTIGGAIDFPIVRDLSSGDDMLAAGVTFFNDQAGDSKFMTNNANLAVAYNRSLDEGRNYIGMGLQGGWAQRSMSAGGLYFGDQWDGAKFDQSLPTQPISSEAVSYIDVSAGLSWFFLPNDYAKVYAGLAAFHLHNPKISFLGIEEDLRRKVVFNAVAQFGDPDAKISFVPKLMWLQQGPNRDVVLGHDFVFQLKDPSQVTGYINDASLALGVYYRVLDAAAANIRINWTSLSLGISFDVTHSDINVITGYVGGPEVMLMWRAPFKSKKTSNRTSPTLFL